jgi:hypothetical protein
MKAKIFITLTHLAGQLKVSGTLTENDLEVADEAELRDLVQEVTGSISAITSMTLTSDIVLSAGMSPRNDRALPLKIVVSGEQLKSMIVEVQAFILRD